MVATIPAVSRAARGHRLVPTAFAHLVGSSLGGAVVGSALALIGFPLALRMGEKRGLIIGIVALIFALGEFGLLKVPRPQRHKQVPAGWRARFPPEIVAGLYGVMLGTGVMTPIWFATVYVMFVWMALSGNMVLSAMIGAIYGATRAVPPILAAGFIHSPEEALHFGMALGRRTPYITLSTGTILMGVAAISLLVAAR